ncbi:lipid-A-disaccharide synthase [Geminocystis sp. CENA526]|uniref:lipid-A-disaccharide synthase n=1 Tax=Geminocystis sp. CENA526 TaxID=1355871 RepID=UPI003D6E0E24
MNDFDIVILSNGPGEITTWVLPVIKQLKSQLNHLQKNIRISLILSPCPHATGNEIEIAKSWQEIDRTQSAEHFFSFLLWGKTVDNWDWYKQGLVIFLGGDQFFTLVVAKRLGFKSLIYAEWEARWYRYIDFFAVMNQAVINKIPARFHHKCTVVGDLMADVSILNASENQTINNTIKIGLLPGSKSSKLTQGVPFLSSIVEYINPPQPPFERGEYNVDNNFKKREYNFKNNFERGENSLKNNIIKKENSSNLSYNFEFILPVAPTVSLTKLASYGNKNNNPFIDKLGNVTVELIEAENQHYLLTSGGVKIRLITKFPAYDELINCHLCLTTVGANTAQLGALAIPMIVLIPLHQLEAMKSWDGFLGILANLPFVGDFFAKLINSIVLKFIEKNKKLYAWPNLWAKKEIVPELIGYLTVEEVGNLVLDLVNNPDKLEIIKKNLQAVRGESGGSIKIAQIVENFLTK